MNVQPKTRRTMKKRYGIFPYVAMTKSELAQLYAPDLTPHSAVNRLMAWIAGNRALVRALDRTGYTKHCKLLQPCQVALIVKYLGEP
jgi:hypothetical protein